MKGYKNIMYSIYNTSLLIIIHQTHKMHMQSTITCLQFFTYSAEELIIFSLKCKLSFHWSTESLGVNFSSFSKWCLVPEGKYAQ